LERQSLQEFTMKIAAMAALLTMTITAGAQADVLLLDAIQEAPPNSGSGLVRPHRGETMSEVFAGFGEPKETKDAVGEPPISRWIYPNYTVYFEYQTVIDVVVHRQ
jgi:hypothetical protein